MDIFSFLETTAEISIAFAGFISLFFVVARRDGTLVPEVAVLIRFILLASLGSMILAALPLILSALGISGSSLWRLSSGTGLVFAICVSLFAGSQRRTLRDREFTALALGGWSLAMLCLVTQLANTVGFPLSPNGGMYLAAIWMVLAISSLNLIDLVFRFALNESDSSKQPARPER